MKENQGTPRPQSDRCDPMLDREANKFGTAAKSVHLHHLVLMQFDSARADIGRVPREKRFEVLHKRRIPLIAEARHNKRHLVAV